ncbi:hypothetical protein POTOM_028232 [Populus tomentosa]|uniref:Uncharacterized protein n=1 Tax=Populus tomentosa TaxID=118781 RepID=A0A8X7ZA20_POPTO|nr:hypothetical protein POTOM_028232 [Populus tomentosa]
MVLPLYNRWHPDIPPVAEVTVGELSGVEMVDFSGGGITKEYAAEDIKNADPSTVSSSYLLTICVFSHSFQFLHSTCNHIISLGSKNSLSTTVGPEIPPVAEVKAGEVFPVEMVDWTGGMIEDDDSAVDVKTIDLSTVHYLNFSIRVLDKDGNPAKPGDLLAVEISNRGPLPRDEWGSFDRKWRWFLDWPFSLCNQSSYLNTMVFLTDVSFAVHVKEGFLEKSILLMLGRPLQSQLTAICDQQTRILIIEKQGIVVMSSEDLKTGKCHNFASFVIDLLGFEMVLDERTVQDIRLSERIMC